jgi:hypothetical protein
LRASGKEPAGKLCRMTSMTRICLRHRRLVLLAWLILAVAGAATASSTLGA